MMMMKMTMITDYDDDDDNDDDDDDDDDDLGAGAMLPMSPMEALRTGRYHQNVSVMIGTNEDDGLILTTALTTDPSLYILYRTLWSVID